MISALTISGGSGSALRRATAAASAGVVLILAACGGSGSGSSSAQTSAKPSASPSPRATGTIRAVFAEPSSEVETIARDILQVGGTAGVAAGLTQSFSLPADITISLDAGTDGPYFDPTTKTIHMSYGFVDYEAAVFRRGIPNLTDEELGGRLAALDGFILMHEMGHAFIDVFDLPVPGREEDAVDALATVFMTEFVHGGDAYALNAAQFFQLLAADRAAYEASDFWDEHSLDEQRAYDIICWVAGSSQDAYTQIEQAKLIGQDRLVRCPDEYRQNVDAWFTLLKPYARAS